MALARRLPPTDQARQRTVNTHMAGGSRQGNTANARPVVPNTQAQGTRNAPYLPPYDRLTLQWFTDDIETDTGAITAWPGGMGGAFDAFGSSVALNPAGDDGGVYLFDEGVYAATLSVAAAGINTADPTQIVSAALQWWDAPDTESVSVILPGGVPITGDTGSPGVSRTAYSQGRGVVGGGLQVHVATADGPGTGLNAALGRVYVTLLVQRVS